MKKMTVASLITLVLCFLAGYLAYQSAIFVRDLVVGQESDCRSNDEKCRNREVESTSFGKK